MDPFPHPGGFYWGANSWVSVLIATCLVPFIYNLATSQLNSLLHRIQQFISDKLNSYEYVFVRDVHSDLHRFVTAYLNSKVENTGSNKSASVKSTDDTEIVFSIEPGQSVYDNFEAADVQWENCIKDEKESERFKTHYVLRIRKEHRHLQRKYLLHIVNAALEMDSQRQERYIYSSMRHQDYWSDSSVFMHPSTFNSLAMEPDRKQQIINDLQEFVKSKEYYEKVGKPWKRGYLLYGPPGTGKSSLIAAVANFLRYDVYDIDLSGVSSNTQLRTLLSQTRPKSVIVIEDIDCCFSKSLKSRTRQGDMEDGEGITLSGMLNFCDGLWSGCSSERIFIFTTNHVEKLDPALLRKGRMDLHICMSYCKIEPFKVLMRNYLGIEGHVLLLKIENLLERVCITPADVAEGLLTFKNDPTEALENLVDMLQEMEQMHEEMEQSRENEAEESQEDEDGDGDERESGE